MNTSQSHSQTLENSSNETKVDIEQLPPTLSVEQAAALVGVGRNAAYRAANCGDLPAFRVGRKLRIPTAQLLRLLGRDDPSDGDEQ